MKELDEQKRKDAMPTAVFPCVLKMALDAIFNKRSPIIIGVDVLEGALKIGTPLCVVSSEVNNEFISNNRLNKSLILERLLV